MEVVILNQIQLAKRWQVSEASLERWRSDGVGPLTSRFRGACGTDLTISRISKSNPFLSDFSRKLGDWLPNWIPVTTRSSRPEVVLFALAIDLVRVLAVIWVAASFAAKGDKLTSTRPARQCIVIR